MSMIAFYRLDEAKTKTLAKVLDMVKHSIHFAEIHKEAEMMAQNLLNGDEIRIEVMTVTTGD